MEWIGLAVLLALFLSRAVIMGRIVPPWQGPDEPTHFALAYFLSRPTAAQVEVEAEVLDSMKRHDWWGIYGRPGDYPVPRFDHVEGLGQGSLEQPLYYGVASAALAVTQPRDLDGAYSHLRVVSVALSMLTLVLGWAGARRLFGAESALGIAAVGSLHPQFLLAALTVNADALLNVWGALAWWQAARVATGSRRAFSLTLLLVAATAAVFTKRAGIVLLVIGGLVAAASLVTARQWHVSRRALALGLSGAALAVLLVLAGAVAFPREFEQLVNLWRNALTLRRPVDQATLADVVRTLRSMIDDWWLVAGWVRFPAPEPWLWVARIVTASGLIGAALAVRESPELRRGLSIGWLFAGLHILTVFAVVVWTVQTAPQGRYLFPAFIPTIALLYLGLRHILPPRWTRPWAAMAVAAMFVMDVIGLTTVIIPAYAPQ